MKLPDFTYHRPQSLASALGLLREHADEAKIIAGGQSLLPMLALRLAQPAHLVDIVDIADVDGLNTITATERGVRVGAGVTQRAVQFDPLVAAQCAILAEAVGHVGHQQTRSRGTVCGSMVHADPSAELPALAIALEATFTAAGLDGTREIAARDFFQGFMTTDLADDEILISVTFPAMSGRRGAAITEVCRRSGDFALVGAVCTADVDDGNRLDNVRISLFGVADTAVRALTAEADLQGCAASQPGFDLGELRPPSDLHATASYRKHIARHVVSLSLDKAIARARRGVN